MRSKGKGVATSSSQPPSKKSKPSKFASASSRDFHPERNISFETQHDLDYFRTLQHFVATNRLHHLGFGFHPFNDKLVRDFYLSLPEYTTKDHKELVFVFKGKRIVLSPSVIESILDLPQSTDEDITSFAEFSLPISISSFMGQAYIDPNALTPKIMSGKLKHVYRVFWLWVRYNILPTTQKSEIPLEGCRLLSAMIEGHSPIPYGTLMYDALIKCALGKPSSKLFFPCLIMRICKFYKVKEADVDHTHPITSTIAPGLILHSLSHCPRDVHVPPPPPTHEAPPILDASSSFPPPPSFDVSRIDPNLYGFLSHSFSSMTAHFDARFDGLTTYVESSLEEMSDRMEELALYRRDGNDDDIGPS